jgi:tRNA(Ile)-lysidine synthase
VISLPPTPRCGAVALSGGLDSSVLLDLAVKSLGASKVIALHIDHQAREPASCVAECNAVDELCAKLNVTLRRQHLTRVSHAPSEQELRDLRYKALIELSQDCDWVALAHHRDDQVETILMNLFRGSDRQGWGGMPQRFTRQSALFIRPLLECWSRADLQQHQAMSQLPFFEDPSNRSKQYLRNRYRHELLPLIDELAPNARQKILEFGQVAKGWNEFIEAELQQRCNHLAWKPHKEGQWSHPREVLQQWPKLVLDTWCHHTLCQFSQKNGSLHRQHVEKLSNWISSSELGAFPEPFPANVRFRARKREIICLKD